MNDAIGVFTAENIFVGSIMFCCIALLTGLCVRWCGNADVVIRLMSIRCLLSFPSIALLSLDSIRYLRLVPNTQSAILALLSVNKQHVNTQTNIDLLSGSAFVLEYIPHRSKFKGI